MHILLASFETQNNFRTQPKSDDKILKQQKILANLVLDHKSNDKNFKIFV